MISGKKILAVIPARGGSKRLPRKNVRHLSGKPLIAWTIEAANQCHYIDRTIVSTEDEEIAAISRRFGADVPFARPLHLASDDVTTIDVILNVVATLSSSNEKYDYVVVLQPTSPLRTSKHLTEAIELMLEKNARSIVSVSPAEHHPLWCNTLPDDLSMTAFVRAEVRNKRSQDLPIYYRLNGAIYICAVELLEHERTLLPSVDSIAYRMSPEVSLDIDSKDDFMHARCIMENWDKANGF